MPTRAAARALLLITGIVPLLLSGCAGQQANAVQLAANQIFTWPNQQEAKIFYDEMLDPASITSFYDQGTINMLFVGLVRLDGNLNVVPDAAIAMPEIDPSGKTYTFHLRPGMKFSDGQPMEAQDFAYSIDRALDPTLCTVLDAQTYKTDNSTAQCTTIASSYLNHILGADARMAGNGGSDHSLIATKDDPSKGLSVVDPLTLKIRLDAPISYFLEALTYPTSYAVEQSFIAKYPGGTWIHHLDQGGCSGPFEVKSFGDGTQLTMAPNPFWEAAWDKQITLTAVVRPLVASPDDEYNNYRKGEYDYTDVPAHNYSIAKGQGDFYEIPTLATHYFGLNWTKAPFDNLLVRRAFALALNKQVLVDRAEDGGANPSNHIVPRGMPGYNPNLHLPPPDGTESITGNQGAALDVLNQARATCPAFVSSFDKTHAYCRYIATSGPKEIDLHARASADAMQLATIAAQQWNAVLGVNVQVIGDDTTTLFGNVYASDPVTNKRIPSPYQMWNIGWIADYPDAQDWLSLQFMSGVDDNASWVGDSSLDKLLASADVEQDPAKRTADYNQAEQMISDEVAWIPYQQDKLYWRLRPWVTGFGLNPLSLMADVKWADVKILQH